MLTLRVTQSEVSPAFKMRVPVYVEYEGGPVKLGSVVMVGSSTSDELKVPLVKRPRRVLINANNDILATSVAQK